MRLIGLIGYFILYYLFPGNPFDLASLNCRIIANVLYTHVIYCKPFILKQVSTFCAHEQRYEDKTHAVLCPPSLFRDVFYKRVEADSTYCLPVSGPKWIANIPGVVHALSYSGYHFRYVFILKSSSCLLRPSCTNICILFIPPFPP